MTIATLKPAIEIEKAWAHPVRPAKAPVRPSRVRT